MSRRQLTLEYDDFHWRDPENCLDFMDTIIKEVPDIKISLFTIPYLDRLPLSRDLLWCKAVKRHIENNNIVLARHGFSHSTEEFKYFDYNDASKAIRYGDKIFTESGLLCKRVFRGPHWGINSESVQALNNEGFTHLYNHVDYKSLEPIFLGKVIYYNWNLKDDPPNDIINIVAHGHTHNVCNNGIKETFDKVLKFIKMESPEFKFVDEI